MSKYRLWRIIGAVFVILLQILMCNRIALWGIATPFVVVYLFLKIPSGLKPSFFDDGLFFHWASHRCIYQYVGCLCFGVGYRCILHNPLLARLQYRDRGEESFVPSFDSLGLWGYMLYTFVLTFVFCTVLFCAESFSFFSPLLLTGRIVGSTLLTVFVLLVVDLLIEKKR